MKVSVIGTGYLGATHATALAMFGNDVVGFDVDPSRIDALRAGRLPFFEPGLAEPLAEHVATGSLRFTSDPEDVRGCRVHFVCVGTPQCADNPSADLSFLFSAIDALATRLNPGDVVVGRSTVPVGTAERIAPIVENAGAQLVWNPEFLREGFALSDCLRPDRLVLGAADSAAVDLVLEAYQPAVRAGTPIVRTGFATAELAKVAANAFLASKISFINAMAELCDASGADVRHLARAIALDPRVGSAFLRPGVGYGGSCLPKDVRALAARAGELGVSDVPRLLWEVDAVNLNQRAGVIELVRKACGGSLEACRVAVLGLSFKPDSDDIRDSPALAVAQLLVDERATVRSFDPHAMRRAAAVVPEVEMCRDPVDACTGAEVLVVLTEWDEFCRLDPGELSRVVAHPRVVDARHCLDPQRWRAAGWSYRAVGVPAAASA